MLSCFSRLFIHKMFTDYFYSLHDMFKSFLYDMDMKGSGSREPLPFRTDICPRANPLFYLSSLIPNAEKGL